MKNKYIKYKRRKWIDKRKEAFEYHGRKCSECNSADRLVVHHLTYENTPNEKMEDLQILCEDCHNLLHGGGPRTRNFPKLDKNKYKKSIQMKHSDWINRQKKIKKNISKIKEQERLIQLRKNIFREWYNKIFPSSIK